MFVEHDRWSRSRLMLFTLVACFGLLPSIATAQSSYTEVATIEGCTEYRLANDCRVLFIPDESSNSVTINMTVFVGSRHEGYGETGMAHLLEHMLFKGTEKHGDIDKELKEKGVLDMNGTTSYDRTNYYETLPADDANENVVWAIAMEADRLQNCFIKGSDLLSEMTVVRSEFERNENSPLRVLMQRLMANAYEWHNYGKNVIGNKADIERVPAYRLKEFYHKYYRADNCMLIVAGKFDRQKALDAAIEHFGSIEVPAGEVEQTYTTEPTQDGERIVYLNRTGDVPLVAVGYHIPAVAHEDYAAVQIMDWILGDEPSGRLYESLVKDGKKASTVFTFVQSGYDPGLQLCFAQLEDGVDVDEVRSEMIATIEKIATDGVTDAEVARAIASISKEKEDDPTDAQKFAATLSNWAGNGDWRLYFIDRDRIENVTADDVKRVAERYLKKSNRTVGIFEPIEEPDRATIPSNPRIANLVNGYKGREATALGESFEPTADNIAKRVTRGQLESGIKYAMLPKKTNGGKFYLTLTLRYGNEQSLSPAIVQQSCSMLPNMLERGTTTMTRQELEDRSTAIKCDIGVSGGTGTLTFSIEGRKEFSAEAIDLLIDILRNPSFPVEELDRLRSQAIAGIESGRSEPQTLAFTALAKKLTPVGKDNIHYVADSDENIERYKMVTIDSVKNVYEQFLSGTHGELTVVGDVDPEMVKNKLQTALKGWTSEQPYERIKDLYHTFEPETIMLETPDKKNAFFIMGANMEVRDDDPDWAALYVASDILGGGSLSSRLGEKVREEKGLSYSVGSRYQAESLDRTGGFLTFAIANPANRDKVLETIDGVFDDFMEYGITDKELESTKTTYAKQIEEALSNEKQLMGILHRYQSLDRDEKFLQARLDSVARVTKEEVNSATRKLVNDKKLITVVAGDFANANAEDAVKDE